MFSCFAIDIAESAALNAIADPSIPTRILENNCLLFIPDNVFLHLSYWIINYNIVYFKYIYDLSPFYNNS